METQIYSIQTVDEALECISAGADRIGVLIGPINGSFPCAVDESTAVEIFSAIDNKAIKVLISIFNDEEKILSQVARTKPDVLHLCADYKADLDFKDKLNQRVPSVLLMEAVGVESEESITEALEKSKHSDLLILDSVTKSVPGVGAAGTTHDWSISKKIVEKVNIPVILAGGLGPDNVKEAIQYVKPFGVDSLTKTSVVENGKIIKKDIEKVKKFCERAKNAEK